MAVETRCQTPGAVFHTLITPTGISVDIEIPLSASVCRLTEDEAKTLEANIHNALELVLRPFFHQSVGSEILDE